MKYQISKEDHENLTDDIKTEYTEKGGSFFLNVEGWDDRDSLLNAKNNEKKARQDAEAKLKTANEALSASETKVTDMLKGAVPKADVEALENQYKTKNGELETKYKGEIESLQGSLKEILVDNKALAIATEISVSPDLIIPHIAKRLTTETDSNGKVATRVLGTDGKISALSVDDLKKEFINNASFAKIIKVSEGSGGGANGSNGGGANGKDNLKQIDYSKASTADKLAHIKAKRQAQGLER